MSEISERPQWATWFQNLGAITSFSPPASTGEDATRIIVSSPTGQFVPWMIAAGALDLNTNLIASDAISLGSRYATWHTGNKRMSDASFVEGRSPGQFKFDTAGGAGIAGDIHPVRLLPDSTPPNRGGSPPKQDLRDRLRDLPGLQNTWHTWWARHCISPVVIIGDGRDYLQAQRKELLEKAPTWFSQQAFHLLSEESGQTKNAERMYFHPFMVFSPEIANDKPWLRQMKPRLVIVTSWSAYNRRHHSLFAGVPHIIITNRRVPSSLDAASKIEFDLSAREFSQGTPPPSGVFLRTFTERVPADLGDIDDDESEWEL